MISILRGLALSLAVGAGLGLVACGGDTQSGQPAGQTPAPKKPAQQKPSAQDIEEGGESAVEPGENLPLGQRALTTHSDPAKEIGGPSTDVPVAVAVLKVRKGKISDLQGFNLDKKQKRATPYYIDYKVQNRGKRSIDASYLDTQVTVEEPDGKQYAHTNLIVAGGTFRPCPPTNFDKRVAPGKSQTNCVTVFLPKRVDFERVRFDGDPEPVFWKPGK